MTTVYLQHGQIAVAIDIELSVDTTEEFGRTNRYALFGDLLAGRITTIVPTTGDPVVEKSYYYLDHLNSTKCVTDEDGVVVVMYEYRAFGEQLKRLDANGLETDDSAKYSYGGKELDDGTNLYYFNARYYDATIGRFINVDPVQDGSNWYVYCNNNPLCFVDPTGLHTFHSVIHTFKIGNGWEFNGYLHEINAEKLRPKLADVRDTLFGMIPLPGNADTVKDVFLGLSSFAQMYKDGEDSQNLNTLGNLMRNYSEGLDNGSVEMFISVQTYRLKESDSPIYEESEGDRIGKTYMWLSFKDKKIDKVTSILFGNVDDFDNWFNSGYPGVKRNNGTDKTVCGEITGTITSKGIYGVNDGYTDVERGQEVTDVIRNFDKPGQEW